MQGGFEVHLMLKPEKPIPKTFASAEPEEKQRCSLRSWKCGNCGARLGDTRAVGPGKSPLTAFKPQSVLFAGREFSKKAAWPKLYEEFQSSGIECRGRDSFFGFTAKSSSHP